VQRSPRCCGLARGRWRLVDLGRVIPWLRGRARGTIARLLRRLGLRYKRGRRYLHSPDPAYAAKLAAITAAQLFARAHPQRVVLLDQDEFTYHRRPTVSRAFAPVGGDAPRADQGWGTDKERRIAACLEAMTGQVIAWQRRHFERGTLRRFYQAVVAAYPDAEAIYLVQDNWPVHFHPELLAALPPPLVVLPLPTYAPWTNPVEDLWRALFADVLHHHDFGDDWDALQAAVTAWLDPWTLPSPTLLQAVALSPDY
jgi:hypothetical protein